MAVGNFIFFVVTALVAVNLIFAESQQAPPPPPPPPAGGNHGAPPPPPAGGNHGAPPPPPAGGNHGAPPPPPAGDNEGAPPQGGPNQEPNERFFFLNRFQGCNYTATPGATCLSCSTASRCLPSNVGVVRVCRGFLPYCNAGRCSFIAPANCTASG